MFNHLIVSQVSLPHWVENSNNGIHAYDKIVEINGIKPTDSAHLYSIVDSLPLGVEINYLIKRDNEYLNISIPSNKLKLIDIINIYAVQFVSGLILIIIGSLVYFLKQDLVSSKIFFILCMLLAIWFIEDIDNQTTYSLTKAVNISYLCLIFSPAFWIILGLVFPARKSFTYKRGYIYLIPILVSLILVFYHVKYHNSPLKWEKLDLIILTYILFGTSFLLGSSVYSYYKPTNSLDKQRAGIILLGSLFGFVLPAIGCIIIILLGYSYITYMALLVVIFPVSIAYAIAKYKLFDIEVIIQQTLVYTALSGVLGLGIVILIFSFNYFFASEGGWKNAGFFIILSVFLVAALNPAKNKIQNMIDTAFFRYRYDYERTIFKLSEAMTSILNLDEIASKIISTIMETMQTNAVTLYLYDRKDEVFNLYQSTIKENLDNLTLPLDNKFVVHLQKYKKEIFHEDIFADKKYKELTNDFDAIFKSTNAALVLPLFFQDDLVGMLFLGDKKSGLSFSSKDINLLKILANQSAIAIENAYSFKLIEDYAYQLEETNKKLTETHLQLIQAEKMSAVGQLAAGIAHEIKNPLNIIEGARYFLSTEIDHGNNENIISEYLDYIKNQVKRTDRLINSLLDFSKPEIPSFKLINLNSILDNAIVLMKKNIEDNKITLTINLDENLPNIVGDQNQLWQVFINVIMNAVQAMPNGGNLLVESGILQHDKPDKIYVKFEDNGIGIDKNDLNKIFDPFFTTKSKGHGLGLAICYKIIESHNGRIEVNSEKGKGSYFLIIIPVNSNN